MRKSPTLLLACAALLAACSSSSESTAPSTSTTSSPAPTPAADSRGGIPPGYPLDVDVVAPLVITTIGPDPIPVTGTDGKVHVAYELSVLNSGPRPATITKVDTLADGPEGATVATIGQQETVKWTLLIPNLLPDPVTEIPAGRTAVLVLDDVYDSRGKVPADLTHRLAVTLGKATPQVVTPDQSFEELGGNYVIIDIGGGNFAFYAHMRPGSASVKVGDKVTRGQVIGRLGNSGNTTEAHLHFHVMRAAVPLSSDNVPFEIDRLTLVGERFVPEAKPSEHTNQLPLAWDVIDFPPAP